MKLTDEEMKTWAKEISFNHMFKERTKEDIDIDDAISDDIFKTLRMWRISCEYGKHEYSQGNYVITYTFIYNEDKTEWKSTGIIMCNTSKEDNELTTELQKELDETLSYKNVTNPDGSYTQYIMKGNKCYGFHTYTKEEIEGIRKLEQKIENEMWYGEYTKNKETMSADKEPNLTEGHSEIEIEKQRLWEKHNKHEGAVKGFKKDRSRQTNLTPPKKKRK